MKVTAEKNENFANIISIEESVDNNNKQYFNKLRELKK